MDRDAIAGASLLDWYDRHRRELPWRAPPKTFGDPYAIWLSEVMLQQTTVQAVKPYFARFLSLFPDIGALASAPSQAVMSAWAGLGYYSRARNLHACAKDVVARFGGRFPRTEAELLTLPGIGAYTAAAIAAIAFDVPAIVVDGNVERVMTRFFAIDTPLPAGKALVRAATARLASQDRPGDFAQATMDLGATICTPRHPACAICPLMQDCLARKAGEQHAYPRKSPKSPRPRRFGAAFVCVDRAERLLVRTRANNGLLGAMTEVPNTLWEAVVLDGQAALAAAPAAADWRRVELPVEHGFTHFALSLDVYAARLDGDGSAFALREERSQGLRWVARDALAAEALPTLFARVVEAGLALLDADAA